LPDVHRHREAGNIGDTSARPNIVFVVDKGKPIIQPIAP
jgi:hypothetical protein